MYYPIKNYNQFGVGYQSPLGNPFVPGHIQRNNENYESRENNLNEISLNKSYNKEQKNLGRSVRINLRGNSVSENSVLESSYFDTRKVESIEPDDYFTPPGAFPEKSSGFRGKN